jgi:hypothetical protein
MITSILITKKEDGKVYLTLCQYDQELTVDITEEFLEKETFKRLQKRIKKAEKNLKKIYKESFSNSFIIKESSTTSFFH